MAGKAGTAWKGMERWWAKVIDGRRRGPDFLDTKLQAGKDDVIHPHYSSECKLHGRITWGMLKEWLDQAEDQANDGKEPLLIVKKKNDSWEDVLVIQRARTFALHRLGKSELPLPEGRRASEQGSDSE